MIKRSPWTFIPILYFLQAIPVTVVQELTVIIYKDLGIANESITRWSSLIALPWALQMVFGPLVDLNFTKRGWITAMQAGIAVMLIVAAFMVQLPQAFEFTLIVLAASAVMSALCNIATDGFAIMAMDKTEQAQFAGIMSTFYRLGRLFCVALLVFIVGLWMKMPGLPVQGQLSVKKDGKVESVAGANLMVVNGLLGTSEGAILEPPVTVPPGTFELKIEPNGDVMATRLTGVEKAGNIPATAESGSVSKGTDPKTAWTWAMILAAIVYGLFALFGRFTLPRPALDTPRNENPTEVRGSLARTVYLLGAGLSTYFLINAALRLTLHSIAASTQSDKWKGWLLSDANTIPFLGPASPKGLTAEFVQLGVCLMGAAICFTMARKSIRGTETGEALGSFVRQSGFPAILFFVTFYRFPEAMVGKITPLFLKDGLDKGGLALPNEQIGVISSFVGVIAIIAGGILGGWVVSKIGLRKAFWPLALAMHVPNLLYLWASYGTMPMSVVNLDWPGPLNLTIGAITFVDQMGYGFGFAAYMVYLMWVAQRGNFRTAHYAIGTGLGALCIQTAGVLSGVVQSNFGYRGVFIAVLIGSIPGLVSLLIVPLDESHKQIKVEVE